MLLLRDALRRLSSKLVAEQRAFRRRDATSATAPTGSSSSRPSRSKASDTNGLLMAAMLSVPLLMVSNASSSIGHSPCACDHDSSDQHREHEQGGRDDTRRCHLPWVKGSPSTQAECHQTRKGVSQTRQDGAMGAGSTKMFDPARSEFFDIKLTSSCTDPPVVTNSESTGAASGDRTSQLSGGPCSPAPLLHNTIIVLPGLLTAEECELIVLDAESILRTNAAGKGCKTEKWANFSRFSPDCRQIMEKVLREHVLDFIEQRLPDVAQRLFRRDLKSGTIRGTVLQDHRPSSTPVPTGMPMDFYWDDPVVIKYIAGNRLAPHEDMRELTIVIPLNPLESFPLVGGGTRFWLEGTSPACAESDGGVSIQPPPGAGIIFNGDITHSGNSVHKGTRFVLMTSINLDDSALMDE